MYYRIVVSNPSYKIVKYFTHLIFLIPFSLWFIGFFFPQVQKYFSISSALAIPLLGFISLVFNLILGLRSRTWHAGTTFISLAILSYGLGELIWYITIHFFNVELPYPSSADIWYSLFYPLLVSGLLIIILKVQDRYKAFVKFANLLFIIILFVVYSFLVSPNNTSLFPDLENLKMFFDTSYIIWDAILLMFTIVLTGNIVAYSKSHRYPFRPIIIIGISILLMLLGDTLFSYTTSLGTYTTGNYIDMIYFLSIYLLTLAALDFHKS